MRTTTTLSTAAVLLAAIVASNFAQAETVDSMMARAYSDGKASGEVTGKFAEGLRASTRSLAVPRADVKREGIAANGCATFRVAITMPQVPDTKGQIVGDYVTTSRFTLCPGDQPNPPPQVLDCKVGPHSCMPPAAQ